jgi:predicted glutamine amidotransferase
LGLGWYDDTTGPFIVQSPHSAETDPAFTAAAAQPHGDTGIVHFRAATPGLEINPANSHPFTRGELMMAHNGAIFPQEKLDEILPPEWRNEPHGTTDSERYFLAIVAAMQDGLDEVAAIRRVVAHSLDRFLPTSLNAFLVTPRRLCAVNWFPDEPWRPEYYELLTGEQRKTYFDLSYRVDATGITITSTGWSAGKWHTISRGHILTVERGTLALHEHDLLSNRSRPLTELKSAA